jgi:DNA-binding SARP family transcriptional activator
VRRSALARPRLLLTVQGRWERLLTAVVAGAGFGKSTLLAQAVDESSMAPSGIDATVRIEPAHASARRLAAALLAGLGADPPELAGPGDLVELVADVVWSRAPERVCFVLDDVHLLAAGSAGLDLLGRLVEALPANAHVLLGARSLPEIGIARRAVAGDAVVLREHDLRFTDRELEEFARLRGVAVDRLAPARGWPALAELLARATGVTPGEYVWEQVIGPLDPTDRARVEEVVALGGADDALATAVAGVPVDLADVLRDVPLARCSDTGWWEIHDVVAQPVLARESPGRIAEVRARGGGHARARGDVDRALRLFVAAGARDEILALLRDTFVQLGAPEDPSLAAAWAAMVPDSLATEPEVLLLRTVAESVDSPERGYAAGEVAVAAFASRGDVEGEVAALARLGAIAYSLVNLELIAPYVERVGELARTGHPWAVAFDAVCRGVMAGVLGRWREAEAILRPVAADPATDPSQGLAGYFCARAQLECGRIHEAALSIERMPEAHRRRVQDGVLGMQVAIAQALGTADDVFDDLAATVRRSAGRRPLVARRIAQAWLVTALATSGDLAAAREAWRDLERYGTPAGSSVDDELVAAATIAVVERDEQRAADLLARVPDRGALYPPREGSVLFYVLRPEVRAAYDALDLEGVFAQRRALAVLLVAGRSGDLAPAARYAWPREPVVRWFAPPPWLAEAAVYCAAGGGTPPDDLLARHGAAPRAVLADLAQASDARVAGAARALMAALPAAAAEPVALRVLGPLEVDVGGARSAAPELRRERVRSLLGLLVLRRSVHRLEAASILWPDLGEDQALGNLRVTLSHLLRLLEPHRTRHAPSSFVRQDRDTLTLVGDDLLAVDAWEFEAAVAEAEELERASAPSLALEAYRRAVLAWRGELLADLGPVDWLGFDRLRLGTAFVRSALRAGELLAARAEHAEAIAMAERAIAADPWAEAAYRLLASTQLERGDPAAARRVLQHLDQVLADLGAEAGAATEALRRRCLEAG